MRAKGWWEERPEITEFHGTPEETAEKRALVWRYKPAGARSEAVPYPDIMKYRLKEADRFPQSRGESGSGRGTGSGEGEGEREKKEGTGVCDVLQSDPSHAQQVALCTQRACEATKPNQLKQVQVSMCKACPRALAAIGCLLKQN